MEWKIAIPVLIIGIFLVSGCANLGEGGTLDVSSLAKQIPEVKAFLEEHPNADITVVLWTSNYIENNTDKIHEKCLPAIELGKAYYKAEVNEEGETIVAWLTVDAREVVCIVREGSGDEINEEEETTEVEEEETEEEDSISGGAVAETTDTEEPEEDEDSVLVVTSKDYGKGLLMLNIKNRGRSIEVDCDETVMVLKDSEGEAVCSSGHISSGNFKCVKGCGTELPNNEASVILINVASCGALIKGSEYQYKLVFTDEAEVSGTFTA